jgi:hypothetical protein
MCRNRCMCFMRMRMIMRRDEDVIQMYGDYDRIALIRVSSRQSCLHVVSARRQIFVRVIHPVSVLE